MKKNINFQSLKSVLILTFVSAGLFAQAQSSSGTQTSTTQSTAKKSKFSVKYFGDMSGSSIGNPGAFRSDLKGSVKQSDKTRAEFYHEPALAYNYTGSQTVYVKTPFTSYARPNTTGDSFEMDNPSLGVQNAKLVDGDEFNLLANIAYQPGTSIASRDKKETFSIGSTLLPEYRAVDSKLVYRSYNKLKQYFYSADQKAPQRNFKIELQPEIQYRISEKFYPSIGAKIVYNHTEENNWNKWAQSDRNLNLSAYWVPSKNLKIVPQLRILEPREISDRNTEIGMLVYGTFL